MIATQQVTPVYEDRHLVLDDDGNITLSTENTPFEILQRLTAYANTYLFDPRYGSNIFRLINQKRTQGITNNQIVLWVREALKPMIENGEIQQDIKVFPFLNNNFVKLQVICYNIQGKPITAEFSSLLYS